MDDKTADIKQLFVNLLIFLGGAQTTFSGVTSDQIQQSTPSTILFFFLDSACTIFLTCVRKSVCVLLYFSLFFYCVTSDCAAILK